MSRVAVVIPCFNQGEYIDEAVDSVLAQTFTDFEIVIIDDGSTDSATAAKLADYRRPRTRVIRTANSGLAGARNRGIEATSAEYILPLDADDRIGAGYLEKGVAHLDSRPSVGIVYCEAEYFEGRAGKWELGEYRFPDILWRNTIFCSALFRRADWEATGGYRPAMKYGWEDWDFWLSLIALGRQVHRLEETMFFYRIKDSSMFVDLFARREKLDYSVHALVTHHADMYAAEIFELLRHRYFLYGRARVVPRLLPAVLRHGRPWMGYPRRLAAMLVLLCLAACGGLRRRAPSADARRG